jgi:tetratricopeptide (TPR) repeat protein
MNKKNMAFESLHIAFRWLVSRVAVIYVIIFIFCLTCMDLKKVEERIKVRHLNDIIPDFTDLILFSKDQNASKNIDWSPYQDYYELILRYIPKDKVTEQLLGYVDYYNGHEQKAIALFKDSAKMDGKYLFWSNYDLGVIYLKKEMWPEASEYLLNAISANTKLTLVLMQDSMIYRQILISPYFNYSLSDELNDAQSRAYILLLSSLYHMKLYSKVTAISNLGLGKKNLAYKDAVYYYDGLAFYEMGQYKNAFLLLQESLALDKDNPDVYYYIADIYQKVGHLEMARDLLQISYTLHQKKDPRFPYENLAKPRFF